MIDRQLLAMTLGALRPVLAAALDKVDDLVALDLVDDLGLHRSTCHQRRADSGPKHQNIVELNFIALGGCKLFNAEHIARVNFVLLATGLEDRKHGFLPSYTASCGPGFPVLVASAAVKLRALIRASLIQPAKRSPVRNGGLSGI